MEEAALSIQETPPESYSLSVSVGIPQRVLCQSVGGPGSVLASDLGQSSCSQDVALRGASGSPGKMLGS